MRVNFYWEGDNFRLLNRIAILSHMAVGHDVVMWAAGNPVSEYWIDDLNIPINQTEGKPDGWRVEPYSKMVAYKHMLEHGECWADCDAIALKEWPDTETILVECAVRDARNRVNLVWNGVMRLPIGSPVLQCALKKIIPRYGNMRILYRCCKDHNVEPNYKSHEFFPVTPGQNLNDRGKHGGRIYTDYRPPEDSYSYHTFHRTYTVNDSPEDSFFNELCERFKCQLT